MGSGNDNSDEVTTRMRISQSAQKVQDFIGFSDSKSAVSMATMGGMVVLLTTTLCSSFNLPAAIVALVLSFFAATIVFQDWRKKLTQFVIVALVIFHMARGGNSTLTNLQDSVVSSNDTNATLNISMPSIIPEAMAMPVVIPDIPSGVTNSTSSTNAPTKKRIFNEW